MNKSYKSTEEWIFYLYTFTISIYYSCKKKGIISSYNTEGNSFMEKQFLKVYEENADAIFRFCYLRLFERELARDFMQQAFLKTWEYLNNNNNNIKEIQNLRAFVFKVARNLIIDYSRIKKENVSVENMIDNGEELEARYEDINLKIDLKEVKRFLKYLEDDYQEVLTLRYIEGLRPKEIAEILGKTEDLISVRIHRGLKKMKEILKTEKFNL